MFDANLREEFITIIASDAADAMRQFRQQGLDRQGYSIVHRMGAHRFSVVTGDTPTALFGGQAMIAATFSRRVNA